MTQEEHTQLIQEIGANLTDQTKVTNLLTRLSTDYIETLENATKLTTDNETLSSAVKKAKEDNMELFLQVGSSKKQIEEEATKPETKPEENKLSYDDLFDENGNLK
jgi:hypothetical protein